MHRCRPHRCRLRARAGAVRALRDIAKALCGRAGCEMGPEDAALAAAYDSACSHAGGSSPDTFEARFFPRIPAALSLFGVVNRRANLAVDAGHGMEVPNMLDGQARSCMEAAQRPDGKHDFTYVSRIPMPGEVAGEGGGTLDQLD